MVWPNKKVEAGSVISANLVWGDKWKKSVFEGGVITSYSIHYTKLYEERGGVRERSASGAPHD